MSREASDRAERVAQALRQSPPSLDELARARLEKKLVAAVSDPLRAAPRAKRSYRPLAVAGAVAALAAVALLALGLFGREPPPVATGPEPGARFEVFRGEATAQRGTLDEGSPLETSAEQTGEIRIGSSTVRLSALTRVRVIGSRPEHVQLELERGAIDIAFHPSRRGEERLGIETALARVEVVGTVFRVE
ncbi:MAG: FecR domain-containing protein, partial [Sandaracinaceae bacterium]|nr:FecR domain-containing protein [Sandaracinaceae bacterium]